MLIAFISWWYSKGWAWRAEKILDSLEKTMDYFSIGLLVKTWFSPFRQIDAGKLSNASLEQRMRKFFDRTFSRFMGAAFRTILMLVGMIVILCKAIIGLFALIIWPILPIFPLIAFILFASGWTPQIVPNIQKSINNIKIFDNNNSKTEKNNILQTDRSDK